MSSDPSNPPPDAEAVIRGGSWFNMHSVYRYQGTLSRSAAHSSEPITDHYYNLGLRLVIGPILEATDEQRRTD